MSEIVERVARALMAADPDPGDHRFVRHDPGPCLQVWQAYEKDARLAITAMREPTEAMEGVGSDLDDVHGHLTARLMWRAMIDEALAPERPTP